MRIVSSASVCQGRGGSKEVSDAELALEGTSSAHCLHAGGTLGVLPTGKKIVSMGIINSSMPKHKRLRQQKRMPVFQWSIEEKSKGTKDNTPSIPIYSSWF